jgi:FKBP-type peptidyl-prolyl cis-trans isomerase
MKKSLFLSQIKTVFMNKMKLLESSSLLIAGSCLLLTSCLKDNTDELKAREEKYLESYLLTNNITTPPTASGLYYIVDSVGTGPQPTLTGVAKFDYTMKLINDDVIVSTIKDTAVEYEIYNSSTYYTPITYKPEWLISGLKEGIMLMHEGEIATFIIPSSLAWKGTGNTSMGVDPYTTVIYQISLHDVADNALGWEEAAIAAYLDTVPPEKVVDTTSTGVIHIIDKAGTGDAITNGSFIHFRYKGYFIDGHKFTELANTDAAFNVTIGESSIIAGINEGLKLMKKGELGRLIIPYKQGYNELLTVPAIPPFSTLVFEIRDLQ